MKINGSGRLRGGYDIDDVKLHFFPPFMQYVAQRFGDASLVEKCTDYCIGKVLDVTPEEGQALLRDFYESGGLDLLPPVEGSLEALKYLGTFADDYTLTARDCMHRVVTERTLQKHFAVKGVVHKELHFCFNHHSFCGTERKSDVAAKLKLDYMVDDSPENAIEISSKGIPVLLMRRDWNRHVAAKDNIISCANWEEVVGNIEKLKRARGL